MPCLRSWSWTHISLFYSGAKQYSDYQKVFARKLAGINGHVSIKNRFMRWTWLADYVDTGHSWSRHLWRDDITEMVNPLALSLDFVHCFPTV